MVREINTKMKYKGYLGEITYDDDAKIFHGEVIGLKDIITFQGRTVNELKKAFQDSINDYLAWCNECDKSTSTSMLSASASTKPTK